MRIGNWQQKTKRSKKLNHLCEVKTMWKMNDVININYEHDYVFHVVFDNGLAGNIDFAEYIDRA